MTPDDRGTSWSGVLLLVALAAGIAVLAVLVLRGLGWIGA